MLLLQKDEATAAQRRIPFYLVDATDGYTPETSVTISAGDLKISKNGGGESNHAGTWAEVAGGLYYYIADAGELDTLGFLSLRLSKSGIRVFVAVAQVVAFDPYDSVRAGLTALPAAAAEAAGGLFTRGTGAGQINQAANGQVDSRAVAVETGAIAEMSQGIPPATPTVTQALMYLYMALRNASKATATERSIENDAGTKIAKATMSDNGTTFDQGKLGSGA